MRRVVSDLEGAGLSFALVGGLAVGVRTEPRFTRDIDLVVAVDNDGEAEAVLLRLHSLGYTTFSTVEQRTTGRLATARVWSPDREDPVAIDLLFASSGIESEVCAAAEVIEITPGLSVPVALSAHLAVLKLLSVNPDRPRDLQDLVGLHQALGPSDLTIAAAATRLIMARGTNRGRDMPARLTAWIEGSD